MLVNTIQYNEMSLDFEKFAHLWIKSLKYRPIEGAIVSAIPAPGSASGICMQRITACVLQREKKAAN